MLVLQKIFLLVRFFIWISCNMGLKAKILCFLCFFSLTPLRLECSRSRKTASFLMSPRLKKYKNLNPWSFMNGVRKHGKCGKSSIFDGKLWVIIYLSEMKIVSSVTLLYSSTFCSLLLPFFVLEIFKFKYDKVFVRHSVSISKFEWFEQPWWPMVTPV